MNYEIYNGQNINGYDGKKFMKKNPHLKGTIYLIKDENNKIVSVDAKYILSDLFNIDINLNDDDFMKEYFSIIKEKTIE